MSRYSVKSLADLYPIPEDGVGPWGTLLEPRIGVMLHYDGSFSDEGAWRWLRNDPKCRVSYNWLGLDDGSIVDIAPRNARAWHAGYCYPSSAILTYKDANSAFYGYAFAAKPGDTLPRPQLLSAVGLIQALFRHHQWSFDDVWRITDHAAEAVYGPEHAKAGQRGRKTDITDLRGITLDQIRKLVAK